MTTQPRWEDSGQGDLLELVAMGSPSTGSAEAEWADFVCCLRVTALEDGTINPNTLRREVRGDVKPQRIGAFMSRALARGLVEYTGDWVVSDDKEGRNGGKPARVLRWIGGDR